MKETKDVTACVVDHGLFVPVARRLARSFKKVYYFTPWEKSFPTVWDLIGDGFEDIRRINDPWEVKESCDLYVFPDIGFAPLQRQLLEQGYPVWGARGGDILEISRGKFLQALEEETNLPVPTFHKIVGLTNLCVFLRDKEDLWIKVSRYRGDWETVHWISWEEGESVLDSYAVRFGPLKELINFYVFDPIETKIEDGCDSYFVAGKWPSLVVHGVECKDKSFIGAFQKFEELPEELRIVNEQIGPVLSSFGYTGFFSTEVRITEDGESYFIDPTCRCGSPPSQCQTEMIGNFAEIVWHGANGECIDPEPVKQFGAQAIVKIDFEPNEWTTIKIKEELDQWFKPGNVCKVNDRICFCPDTEHVAWLVGLGNTIEEAVSDLKAKAEELPDSARCDYSSLADVIKEIHTAEKHGVEFSDKPTPEPEIVLEDHNE